VPAAARSSLTTLRPIEILIVCTGNTCRSPMAEGLLRDKLRQRGLPVGVSSAGLISDGTPATDTAVMTMADRGIDIDDHLSRRLRSELLDGVDLVVAMARQHVREVAVLRPDCYPITFTLKELIRRGELIGPRGEDESLPDWLLRVQADRQPRDHLGMSLLDDVADPVGQGPRVYEATADELDDLTSRLVELAWQEVAVPNPGGAER
jgi:protein-tyrosine phosphatase